MEIALSENRSLASQRRTIVGLVMAGILCCLIQYAARISFWQDEAYQVQNVMEQSYGQLASTLGRDQTAPPLFIMGVKLCGQYLGYSEYSLRLIPLLAGILAIVLFAFLAARVLPKNALWFAVALMALSPKLIEHATEVKQYSGDVLAAAGVWLAGAALFNWRLSVTGQKPAANGLARDCLRLLLLSLLAGAVFWYSEVQVFVFTGIALAVLPRFFSHRFRGCLVFVAACLPAAISLAALYFVSIRYQHNSVLVTYWIDERGLPDYAHWWLVPVWVLMSLVRLCNYFCNPLGPIILVLSAVGIVAVRHLREAMAALLLPVGLTMIAALALRYPFGGVRATMFLVPSVVLLASLGFAHLLNQKTRIQRASVIAAWALIASGGLQAAYHLIVPRNISNPRPAIEYVRSHRSPSQGIWIPHQASWDAFRCYWRESDDLVWSPNQTPDMTKTKEFWLVVEFAPGQGLKKRRPQLDQAATYGNPIDQFVCDGGAAFLYASDGQASIASVQ